MYILNWKIVFVMHWLVILFQFKLYVYDETIYINTLFENRRVFFIDFIKKSLRI